MTTYLLPRHVFFCGQEATIVFLDLKSDEYTMIRDQEARDFISLIPRKSNAQLGEAPSQISSANNHYTQDRLLNEMKDAGLLTTDASIGKPITPTFVEIPAVPLIHDEDESGCRVNTRCIWNFMASCMCAAFRLRFWTIQRTISKVEKRKELHAQGITVNLERSRHFVAAFNKLRALFPFDYLCLFDSLALVEFLSRYDIYPTWVFAVQVEPWSAHCWVQDGEAIFNEDIEEAEDYIPIMAI